MNARTIVIIPTYNEVENISKIIDLIILENHNIDVLVVDDNSPDGTSSLVNQKEENLPNRVFLIKRLNKRGLGTAYIDGFKWALKEKYDYIISMDADFSHNPIELPKIIEYLNSGVDVVIGSRYLNGVSVVNWPIARIFLSYIAQIYVRLITSMPIKDPTSGFVAYNSKCIDSLNLDKFRFIGYAFQIEMKYKIWKKKFKLKEHQIIFMNRELGESKLDKKIILEAVYGVLQLRLDSFLNRL
ncbi:MAG: polyprenol monophosphomannose synthase [Bacteroidota bacterium]|nr:polyprenol monophosphomannose synthase [Bacteroidota bacterium]MED5269439.1 polyprenol monophosphomannose synthase [Bacteroidota bacterium]|tara:strand:+ start:53 stop:778 length:726 start_codon:yes stop_codon:yes gene_type:complete